MKKIFTLLASVGLAALTQASPASVPAKIPDVQVLRTVNATLKLLAGLNWQVGDFHKLDLEYFGIHGTVNKSVTQEVPDQGAFWYVSEMNIAGQSFKTETLTRRADGKALKVIVNGQEQDPSGEASTVEVVEQTETTITVPAGTFDCMYVKAKITSGAQTQQIQVWANPVDVNLDGTLKMVVETQGGPLTMQLTEFGHR